MQGYGCVGLHAFTVNLRTSVYMRLSMMHAVSPKACLMRDSLFPTPNASRPTQAGITRGEDLARCERTQRTHNCCPKAVVQSFFIYKATSWPGAALARLRRVKGVMLTITAW